MQVYWDIKLHSITGAFKGTINPGDVLSPIDFSSDLDGGLGNLPLDININSPLIPVMGDYITVYRYDDNHKTGVISYRGFIFDTVDAYETNKHIISCNCQGLFTLFNDVRAREGGSVFGSTIFNYSGNPKNLFQQMVDLMNAQYPGAGFYYDNDTIPNYSISVNLSISKKSVMEVINDIQEACKDRHWFIDQRGYVFFQPKPSVPTHTFTFGEDISRLIDRRSRQDVVNNLYVTTGIGTGHYLNTTSISEIGIIENEETKSDLGDLTTRNNYGTQQIAENGTPKIELIIDLNNKYDVLLIKPGDTFKVENIDATYYNLLIVGTTLKGVTMSLKVEKSRSIGQSLSQIT